MDVLVLDVLVMLELVFCCIHNFGFVLLALMFCCIHDLGFVFLALVFCGIHSLGFVLVALVMDVLEMDMFCDNSWFKVRVDRTLQFMVVLCSSWSRSR